MVLALGWPEKTSYQEFSGNRRLNERFVRQTFF
jgi:hypothetical protein